MRLLVPAAVRLALLAVTLTAPATLGAQIVDVPEPTDSTRRVLVARRATGPLRIDGRLDEADWRTAPVATDFMQARPDYVPTTEHESEVRVLFDEEHLYIGAFNREVLGRRGLRVTDLRRDFAAMDNDVLGVTIGPLGDRRTAFQFQVNPYGAQADVQAFDGGDVFNFNWDAMWRVRTTRTDSGWFAELAIPWASLRYDRNATSWDLNFVRNTRRVAQWSAWMPYPRQFSSWRLTFAGRLDSIAPPPPRPNVRVRPYALGDAQATGGDRRTLGNVGGEVIWAPTANSLVEATVNTDFAQADIDRQVVNLTRFNVFFPERRQFFLENNDLLDAGGIRGQYVVAPFFSRRIGLAADGTPQAIDGGARYAFRSGRATAGALMVREGATVDGDGATVGILRGTRFAGRATRLGATVAGRDEGADGVRNLVTAVDAFTRLGEEVTASAMLSSSTVDGRTDLAATWFVGRSTARSAFSWQGAMVGEQYAPSTGFVSRPNVLLTAPSAALTLQPGWLPQRVVWLNPGVTAFFYNTPGSGELQEGDVRWRTEVLLRDGATITPYLSQNLQRLQRALPLLPGVTIAPANLDYVRAGLTLRSDQSRRFALTTDLSNGAFFDGALQRAELTGRWTPTPFVSMAAAYEVNRLSSIGTRDTSLTTHLFAPELRVFLNPRVQWSAFYQYNTAQQLGTLNARFSWEFAPLSFLYVVYNDRRAIDPGGLPAANSLVVKLSWLRQL
jgi:hypothetical protein